MQTTSTKRSVESLVRPIVRKLHAYVPGEQPKIKGLIKLNTNENPYGPAPEVLAALKAALDGRLRLYPNPTAERLREKLARFHGCRPENIVVGNGSDEVLALATRAFVEPLTGLTHYALQRGSAKDGGRKSGNNRPEARKAASEALRPSRYSVQYFHPSYSLYPVLAAMHGARPKPVSLQPDFSWPAEDELRKQGWDAKAALTFITTPHAPSGRGMKRAEIDELCRRHKGVLLLDEAYVAFAKEDALSLALKYPNVLVTRTFSKAYSLCSLRVGYAVGHPELIGALDKIRDSYNVNGLGQVAAEATLDALPYYRNNFQRIIRSRDQLATELSDLGFAVFPSQANFLLARPPRFSAEAWLEKLRERRVLVRWFSGPEVRDYLRITIGSESELEQLMAAVVAILAQPEQRRR